MVERIISEAIVSYIVWLHDTFIRITQDLTETQLSYQPPDTSAPAIAWHVWHVARVADRIQAGLQDLSGTQNRSGVLANERWAFEGLAAKWKLDPQALGVFEMGTEMKDELTPMVLRGGKQSLSKYALATFSDLKTRILKLNDAGLQRKGKTVFNFEYQPGVPGSTVIIPSADILIINELLFYQGHFARHLGMVEALRGLQLPNGSATV